MMLVLFLFFIFEIQGVSKVAQRLNLLFFYSIYGLFGLGQKKKPLEGFGGFTFGAASSRQKQVGLDGFPEL